MSERFPSSERLRTAFEFRRVFDRGACFRSPFIRIHYERTSGVVSRMGLVVTRKIGNAVKRGRVKRLLREVYRRNKQKLPCVMDIILLPQGGVRTHAEYLECFLKFLEKVGASARCAKP